MFRPQFTGAALVRRNLPPGNPLDLPEYFRIMSALNRMRAPTVAILLLTAAMLPESASASLIVLQNPVASFSQGGFNIAAAIDSAVVASNGWAINPAEGVNQFATFETASDIGFLGGTEFTFNLLQLDGANPGHTIGRFRLSVTTDPRGAFTTWTVLTPGFISATNGPTLTVQGDNSILASGTAPGSSIYTMTSSSLLTGVTGFRLEVLADPSLPANGPGRFSNGNFVLTEFTVDAIPAPEPGAWTLTAGALAWLLRAARRARPVG